MSGYPKKTKDGRYSFVVEAGKGPDGKRKRRTGIHNTHREAKKAMAEIMLEVKNNEALILTGMTLGEYLNYWLENYAKTNTKPKTFAEYEKIVKTHLQPSLGYIKLDALKSIQLQGYYKEKLKYLSAQTVTHHHRLLSKALNDAIDWEFINKNVAKHAKPPKPEKHEMKTLSVEQLNLLTDTAKEITPVYFPIIYASIHTGTRKSELTGLNWDNVDLNAQRFYIRQTITEANGKYFFNLTPKN